MKNVRRRDTAVLGEDRHPLCLNKAGSSLYALGRQSWREGTWWESVQRASCPFTSERCRSKGPHAGRLRRQKLCPNNSGGQRCEVRVSAGSLSSGTSVLLGGRLLPCPHAVFPLHVCVLTSSSVGPRFPLVTSLQALSRQKSHCEVLGVRIPHMNLEDHTIQSIMGFRGAAER